MLEITKVNFNIGSNQLARIKTEIGMMQQNLKIRWKL